MTDSIIVTTDSTCDLGEQAAKYGVQIMPLNVILGGESYKDGVEITPADIFAYVQKTGELPKTSAPNVETYKDFFAAFVAEGKKVIHVSISQKASSAYLNALSAAGEFPGKVFVVDSKALSTGQGLVVLKAADMVKAGLSAEEIVEKLSAVREHVNTSFIPDTLEYLYKGGRCSALSMYGAKILKLHPMIDMQDGQLYAAKKYRGDMLRCISKYVAELSEAYPEYDPCRCFITHSHADEELVALAKEKVAEHFAFAEVIETVAGSVITGHCGRNTLGVLFVTKREV